MRQSSIRSYFTKDQTPSPEIEPVAIERSPQSQVIEPNLEQRIGPVSISTESQKPNNLDISLSQDDEPSQPIINFPKTQFGPNSRSFNSDWYGKYPLLEYSVKLDSIFCYCCRHFGTSTASSPFISGYKDWGHIGNALPKHFSNSQHQNTFQKYVSYKHSKSTGTILSQLSSQRIIQVENNRKLLATHVEVILLCGQQEIPLRGHREQNENGNVGNFLAIVNLLKKHDVNLFKTSELMPNNAQYLSSDIQNDIISSCGTLIRQAIVKEVNESGEIFAIIADEAKDNSGHEQLSICIRYASASDQEIKEGFLGIVRLHKFDAVTISTNIINFLEEIGLKPKYISSQSYDGASVMSGDVGGVHTIIESKIGTCPYVHCHAHRLNLVLLNSCSEIKMVRDVLGLLQAIYNFQSNSVKRAEYFVNSQVKLGHGKILKMPKSCPTRWSSKAKVVRYFKEKLDSVILALKDICETGEAVEKAECQGYITQLCSYKVIFILTILEEILSQTNALSEYLQAEEIIYNQAVNLCIATTKSIGDLRTIEKFNYFWEQIEDIAEKLGIEKLEEITSKRTKLQSSRLKDFLVCSSIGNRDAEMSKDARTMYRSVFFEIIDTYTAEMNRRFTENQLLSRGVTACDPRSSTFLNMVDVVSFCENFSRFDWNISALKSQLVVAKNLFITEKCKTPIDCFKILLSMKSSFGELLKYFFIVLSVPVSSASSERSFSTLKRVKNYLRTSSGQNRTSDLCLISIEKDLSSKFYENPYLVVDHFAKYSKRRVEFII